VLDVMRYWQKARKASLPVGDIRRFTARWNGWASQQHLKILGILP
jgi:aminoglycoside/choline kinase family phosphotransferase